MTLFNVRLYDGQTFQMEADLSRAEAPIRANWHGEEDTWQITPYQTADASHNKFTAANLVAEYFSTGDDDCTVADTVEVA